MTKEHKNIWFTSDTHFGHKNILKYCNRPFQNIDEHDEHLISEWNKKVGPDDTIYHLGDFAFGKPNFVANILRRLNGDINFIIGNHDSVFRKNKELQEFFSLFTKRHPIFIEDDNFEDGGKKIVLCHFPIEVWHRKEHGSWHLHGHTHRDLPSSKNQLRVDVSVDTWNYSPASYEDIKTHMSKKKFTPIDRHGRK